MVNVKLRHVHRAEMSPKVEGAVVVVLSLQMANATALRVAEDAM